jgi:hypothetical protein
MFESPLDEIKSFRVIFFNPSEALFRSPKPFLPHKKIAFNEGELKFSSPRKALNVRHSATLKFLLGPSFRNLNFILRFALIRFFYKVPNTSQEIPVIVPVFVKNARVLPTQLLVA